MSDYLYADPDGIERISRPYDEAAARFRQMSAKLDDLRHRYSNAWGNDDGGRQVRPQVEKALRQMQMQVDALGKALGMYHEGLVGTSKAYREADHVANDASEKWSANVEKLDVGLQPTGAGELVGKRRNWDAALQPTTEEQPLERRALRSERMEDAPLMRRAVRSEHVLAREGEEPLLERGRTVTRSAHVVPDGELPSQRPTISGRPGEELLASRRPMRSVRPGEELEPRIFMRSERPVENDALEPILPADPGQPLQPGHVMPALYSPSMPGIPAEPTIAGERHELLPLEPMEALTPLQPAHYMPALQYRGITAEPTTEA
jgi:hypothetical protein